MNDFETKNGFICITGAPNVGKSSILNAIIGEKISIVTSKPQTTRTSILGVYTNGGLQLVFIDTPGLIVPKDALGKHMVGSVRASSSSCDAVMLVAQAGKKIKPAELSIIETLKKRRLPAILVLNKIDLLDNTTSLLPQMEEFSQIYNFDAIIPVCATRNDGIKELLRVSSGYAKPGPFMYGSDDITDRPTREICAEYVREQLLKRLRDEVPHGIAVVVEGFTEKEDEGGRVIDAEISIYCERDNHKSIILGRSGQMIKLVRQAAQKNLSFFLNAEIHLSLWVKVRKDWRDNEAYIKNFGLNFD